MRRGMTRHLLGWGVACGIGVIVALMKHRVGDHSVGASIFDGVLVSAAGVIAVEIIAALLQGKRSARHIFPVGGGAGATLGKHPGDGGALPDDAENR